ncbi:MAG: hypothetical protein AB7U82_11530 [Blastocatellales bacterium]
MNHDKLNFWLILLLFPCVYFGLAAFYTYYEIYVRGNYERKDGQLNSFLISLAIYGFMTLLASLSYWISLAWLKTEPQQLPRPRLALITVLSALLSLVVLQTVFIIAPGIASVLLYLLFWAASVCLIPALIGVSLVTIHQICFADDSSTQE